MNIPHFKMKKVYVDNCWANYDEGGRGGRVSQMLTIADGGGVQEPLIPAPN